MSLIKFLFQAADLYDVKKRKGRGFLKYPRDLRSVSPLVNTTKNT